MILSSSSGCTRNARRPASARRRPGFTAARPSSSKKRKMPSALAVKDRPGRAARGVNGGGRVSGGAAATGWRRSGCKLARTRRGPQSRVPFEVIPHTCRDLEESSPRTGHRTPVARPPKSWRDARRRLVRRRVDGGTPDGARPPSPARPLADMQTVRRVPLHGSSAPWPGAPAAEPTRGSGRRVAPLLKQVAHGVAGSARRPWRRRGDVVRGRRPSPSFLPTRHHLRRPCPRPWALRGDPSRDVASRLGVGPGRVACSIAACLWNDRATARRSASGQRDVREGIVAHRRTRAAAGTQRRWRR